MRFLQGKHIMLTRTPAQNAKTARLLAKYGAQAVFFPCLRIEYLPQPIHDILHHLQTSEHQQTDIIFTSANGVHAVAEQCSATAPLADVFAGCRVLAVGQHTAQALQDEHCPVHIMPQIASQQGLMAYYKQHGLPKQAIFFRAAQGSDDLSTYFAENNTPLTLVKAYQSVCSNDDATAMRQQLHQHRIDAVLLGSAKTAAYYCQKINAISLANRPVIAVMSAQVAAAADNLALKVQVVAKEPSFIAMLDGLNTYFSSLNDS